MEGGLAMDFFKMFMKGHIDFYIMAKTENKNFGREIRPGKTILGLNKENSSMAFIMS